jgi:predicted Zn-dependent protease
MLAAFATGCSTAPVTHRSQLALISSSDEQQLGLTEFEKMKQSVPISSDAAANAMVQKVGKAIAAIAGSDMPDAKWEFVVFKSDEANAFCLPGGKVGVYSGILPITRDEGGLATVLGHEVAHAAAHHGRERLSQQMVTQLGAEALGASFNTSSPAVQALVSQAYGTGSQLLVELPFSRQQESEADHIGLVYMARAGYQPEAAVDFWKRFAEWSKQHGGSDTPTFLRTHPLDEVRIKQIQGWLPEAKAQMKK